MTTSPSEMPTAGLLVRELVEYLTNAGIEIKAARGIDGYPAPTTITNDGFGTARPRRPAVVWYDPEEKRVVFGVVREGRKSLDSEESLEEYNVFLDHNSGMKDQASAVYVMMPQDLVSEFTSIITHYVHREYWHRIIAVGSRQG